jgi:hypothetical protein
MAENQQIDLRRVTARLGAQLGEAAVELAAANEAIEVLQQAVTDLTVELGKAQGAGSDT